MRPRLAALSVAALVALVAAPPAQAADPIMPLADVAPGLDCEARTVIRGVDITTFDVEIIDVVDYGNGNPKILIEASGAAVEKTGLALGFSGSPIYCRDDAGQFRVIGAVALGVGDFGNRKDLATPIEAILGEPVHPRLPVRRASAAERTTVRAPVPTPLTVSGLSPALGGLVARAAARAGRPLLAAPAGPAGSLPPQQLVPGSAMGVAFSSGDIGLGGVGTVSYTRGSKVWGFGHPFEGVGRRSLLLQDAYVYDVINNPLGVEGITSYKLAAPVNDIGTLLNDAPSAVVGRVGGLPDLIPVEVHARDLNRGSTRTSSTLVADETDVGLPSGGSPLSFIGPLAVFQASADALGGTPARQFDSMCVRIKLRERRQPLGFCNRYATEGGSGFEGIIALAQNLQAVDLSEALLLIEGYRAGKLHVESVDARVDLSRGLRQAFLLGASAPRTVRPGQRVPVKVRVRMTRGPVRTLRVRLAVPPNIKPGRQSIRLVGTPADTIDTLEGGFGNEILIDLLEGGGAPGGDLGPRSLDALAKQVAKLSRFDGVRAAFPTGARRRAKLVPAFTDPTLRISGSTELKLRVADRRLPRPRTRPIDERGDHGVPAFARGLPRLLRSR